jgi:hypothetical protein
LCLELALHCLVAFSFSHPNTQLQLQQLPPFWVRQTPPFWARQTPTPNSNSNNSPYLGSSNSPFFGLVKLPPPTTSRQDFHPFRRLSLGNYISRFPPLDDVPFWVSQSFPTKPTKIPIGHAVEIRGCRFKRHADDSHPTQADLCWSRDPAVCHSSGSTLSTLPDTM